MKLKCIKESIYAYDDHVPLYMNIETDAVCNTLLT